jgi:cytochrome P450
VARILAAAPADVTGWISALIEAELVQASPASRLHGEKEHVFRHAMVRDAAYGLLTANDIATGHRLAGEFLEAAGEHDAAVIAEHLERGGDHGRAATFYLRAAEDRVPRAHYAGARRLVDPYPFYTQLRARSPVRYERVITPGDEPEQWYALLKYRDVSAALRDVETFSSRAVATKPSLPLLQDDPPRHTNLRRRVSKAFTSRRIAELEPSIADVAQELADDMGRGQVELMGAYAIPLPLRVIARIIGIPDQDYVRFWRWSMAIISHQTMAPEERAAQMAEFDTYLRAQIAAPRPSGTEDLMTAILETEVDGEKLREEEMLGLLHLMLVAGNESTANLLGNMLGILADRPDLWRQAREDRSFVDPIIAETLRFESPVQRLTRVTTRPVEVSGVPIPEGRFVALFYGSANRDPEVFADAETFRVDRLPAENLAFGQGIHSCLGAPLACIEARITLNLFLDRFPTLVRAAGPAVRQTVTPASYGYERLPLVLA